MLTVKATIKNLNRKSSFLTFYSYQIQVCKTCKPVRPYVRLFDVTERTNRFRHSTRRRCYICGSGLMDTIVHFGERGTLSWPINWNGASRAAEKADMILCLGSSLKVNLLYLIFIFKIYSPLSKNNFYLNIFGIIVSFFSLK